MTATGQLSRIAPYVSRLLGDDYVQEQVGQALTNLRRSSRRAKGRRTSEALKDTKLRSQVGDAITSLGNARRALAEPPRKPRRLRRAFLLMTPLAAALAWQQRSTSQQNE
ncbi:MAG: hypothetical protein ABI355_15790 [Solirubrobacteraceae bacterium]